MKIYAGTGMGSDAVREADAEHYLRQYQEQQNCSAPVVAAPLQPDMETNGMAVASIMGSSFIILVIFGFLFAPWFTPLFEDRLKGRHRTKYNDPDYSIVKQKLQEIKAKLWIVALSGWAVVIVVGILVANHLPY